MKKLYISDLDGTLLNDKAELSDETKLMLKELIAEGVHFTCATARTAATVTHILDGIALSAPAILMNGVAILDWKTHKYIKVEYLDSSFSSQLLRKLDDLKLASFIYGISNNTLATYYEVLSNESMQAFYEERVTRYNKPYTKVSSFSEIPKDSVVYCLLLDKKEALDPLCKWLEELKSVMPIDFCYYPEIYYTDTWCLEIFSNSATKFNAVQFLRKEYHYDKVIGFGDNLNDISLFHACNEAYAVENAKPAVKLAATDVIGNHNDNSVVRFIKKCEEGK